MEEGNPAGQHTTARSPTVQCNCSFFKTLPAIFKIVQVMCSLLAFICLQNLVIHLGCDGCLGWFRTAAMSGLLLSFIFLILYLLNIVGSFNHIPWRTIDFTSCILWLIFNVAAATKLAIFLSECINCDYSFKSGAIGAIFFGFAAMIAYGCDAMLQLLYCMGANGAK